MNLWILVFMITSSNGNAIATNTLIYNSYVECQAAKDKFEEKDSAVIKNYKMEGVCIPAPVNVK